MNLSANYFSENSSSAVSCFILGMGLCGSMPTQPEIDNSLIDKQYHHYQANTSVLHDTSVTKELDLLASPSNLATSVKIGHQELSEALFNMFQSVSDSAELSHEFINNSPDDYWDLYV